MSRNMEIRSHLPTPPPPPNAPLVTEAALFSFFVTKLGSGMTHWIHLSCSETRSHFYPQGCVLQFVTRKCNKHYIYYNNDNNDNDSEDDDDDDDGDDDDGSDDDDNDDDNAVAADDDNDDGDDIFIEVNKVKFKTNTINYQIMICNRRWPNNCQIQWKYQQHRRYIFFFNFKPWLSI